MERTYSIEKVNAHHWRVIVTYNDGSRTIVGAVSSRKEAAMAAKMLAGWRHKVKV